MSLPEAHRAALKRRNGFTTVRGYERLYGVFTDKGFDAVKWNHPDLWKFSWSGVADDYWCFGSDVFGRQYAYHLPSLRERADQTVPALDGWSLGIETIAPSFAAFAAEYLDNDALERLWPEDENEDPILDIPVHATAGPVPHPALGNLRAWQVVTAPFWQVLCGDVHAQVEGREGDKVLSMDIVQDERGRQRVKLKFV